MTASGVAPIINPAEAGSNPSSFAYKPDVGATIFCNGKRTRS
jgi:hypothetical protein